MASVCSPTRAREAGETHTSSSRRCTSSRGCHDVPDGPVRHLRACPFDAPASRFSAITVCPPGQDCVSALAHAHVQPPLHPGSPACPARPAPPSAALLTPIHSLLDWPLGPVCPRAGLSCLRPPRR